MKKNVALAVTLLSLIPFAAEASSARPTPTPRAQVFRDALVPSPFDDSFSRLSDHRGKVVLVNFVGVECGWTDREMPALVDLYQRYHARGLEIVSIFGDYPAPSAAQARAFVAKNHVAWTVGLEDGTLLDALGMRGAIRYPSNVLVRRNGDVRNLGADRRPSEDERLAQEVEKAIGEEVPEALPPKVESLAVPSIRDTAGRPQPLLAGNKPTVIEVFDARSCEWDSKEIAELARRHPGARFLAISIDPPEKVAACVSAAGKDVPVVYADVRETSKILHRSAGFGIVLADRNGNLLVSTTTSWGQHNEIANFDRFLDALAK